MTTARRLRPDRLRLARRGGRAPRARPPRRGPGADRPRRDSGRGGRAPKGGSPCDPTTRVRRRVPRIGLARSSSLGLVVALGRGRRSAVGSRPHALPRRRSGRRRNGPIVVRRRPTATSTSLDRRRAIPGLRHRRSDRRLSARCSRTTARRLAFLRRDRRAGRRPIRAWSRTPTARDVRTLTGTARGPRQLDRLVAGRRPARRRCTRRRRRRALSIVATSTARRDRRLRPRCDRAGTHLVAWLAA